MDNQINLNKLILQKDYSKRINEIKRIKPFLTNKPLQEEFNFSIIDAIGSLEILEKIGKYQLSPKNGQEFAKNSLLAGYDESKLKFLTLEGIAYLTTHALVTLDKFEYLPVNYFTFYFYTRSKSIAEQSQFIKYSENDEDSSQVDYVLDRNFLIENYSIENSIVFIDGPLIGGNVSNYSIELVDTLHKKNVIPIFFVKNSNSNLVVDNILELRQKYNSDLHWSYKLLDGGSRTNLFKYTDENNKENSKIFFYLKPFNFYSPQRIEFHPRTYDLIQNQINDLIDTIYYLLLVHGDKTNVQIRPIAIAEKYAREILKIINADQIMANSIFTPTMNQIRFGG